MRANKVFGFVPELTNHSNVSVPEPDEHKSEFCVFQPEKSDSKFDVVQPAITETVF